MPNFWGNICTFGEIGDHGDQFLGFPNSLGVWGVLRLDYVGDLFYFATIVFRGNHSDWFLDFPIY